MTLEAIDERAASRAAERIVLAYEIADQMSEFAGDSQEQYAAALTVGQIVIAFGMLQVGMTDKQAIAEFGKAFRLVRRRASRLGKDSKLSEVMTEMHLDQRR